MTKLASEFKYQNIAKGSCARHKVPVKSCDDCKSLAKVRRVSTPAGVKRFDAPIGTPIVAGRAVRTAGRAARGAVPGGSKPKGFDPFTTPFTIRGQKMYGQIVGTLPSGKHKLETKDGRVFNVDPADVDAPAPERSRPGGNVGRRTGAKRPGRIKDAVDGGSPRRPSSAPATTRRTSSKPAYGDAPGSLTYQEVGPGAHPGRVRRWSHTAQVFGTTKVRADGKIVTSLDKKNVHYVQGGDNTRVFNSMDDAVKFMRTGKAAAGTHPSENPPGRRPKPEPKLPNEIDIDARLSRINRMGRSKRAEDAFGQLLDDLVAQEGERKKQQKKRRRS